MDIRGKTALVLGATRSIGRALALTLADAGAKLVVPYFDWPEDTISLLETLDAKGTDYLAVQADLRQPNQVKNLFHQLDHKFSNLDILINNIERGGMPIVHGPYTPEQWDLELETTLKAKWWIFQYALPLLKKSTDAAVVTLSSIAAIVGRAGPAGLVFNEGYAAANRAVSSFTDTWARQGAPTIRVNELMIGFIETRHAEGTRGWDLLSQKQRESICNHTLLNRTGKLEEILKAIMFLIKDATFMTGATIRMDGGYALGHSSIPPMPVGEKDLEIKGPND